MIDQRHMSFLLYNVLNVEGLLDRTRFQDHDRAVFDAVLETAANMARDVFAPHAAKADANEPHLVDGKVVLIPEVRASLDQFIDAGFMTAGADEEWGGQQLPNTIVQSAYTFFQAANVGSMGYPFLTVAGANLLNTFASDAQKTKYMQPMLDGRFFGTMCLSEPQAGSGLADIRTTAFPQADGTYKLKGSKMWISGGCHELTDNIVHLVLAKIEGAPAGVKGISLFIVPRKRLNDDGSLGPDNDVNLMGLNHKMGYRGTTNTLLSFGENGDCIGELIGEPHHGLTYMFQMMNEARIGVALGAIGLGLAGYEYSLNYAKERPQGRHPDEKDPTSAPIMLIEHADVRRMLLAQKVYTEGSLAIALYTARLVDDLETTTNEAEKQRLQLLLDIMTPIVKTYSSEYCVKANDLAIQVLGGYGYTREYPVERYYRDNRLNPIHEGTSGIQAMDLLGRKVTMKQGAALKALMAEMMTTIAEAKTDETLTAFATSLEQAIAKVGETTMALMGIAQADGARAYLANANVYLDMASRVVVSWMWLKQAMAARAGLSAQESAFPDAFFHGKLQACRFMFHWELPQIYAQADLLQSGDRTTMDMEEAWF